VADMSGHIPPTPQPHMNASERARRTEEIAKARASGMTWKQVADKFGVATSTAKSE
jgi:DNA-binding NarL/FixJ family response regulator